MKAMILAAGRGERMRPLTDHTPKPLLPVAGKPLIEYTLNSLVAAGFVDIVINIAHLGKQIADTLGDGGRYGANIRYSDEGDSALETAGGIVKALPLLGEEPFLVVNGDVACDFPLASLRNKSVDLAHLVLIDNPDHHPHGDFSIDRHALLSQQGECKRTYSGIGVYHPRLFAGLEPGILKLRPLLNEGMEQGRISGQYHRGFWMDVGTPERLQALKEYYVVVT